MTRRIAILLSIMLLCLLGLLGMQGYLAYQEFRRQQEYLTRQVDELFTRAVATEKAARVEELVERFLADLQNPELVRLQARADEENQQTVFDLFDVASNELAASVTFEQLDTVTDTLTPAVRRFFLERMARNARSSFRDENINFWTDSLGERTQRNFRELPVDTAALRTAFRHQLDSVGIGSSFAVAIDTAFAAVPAANPWRSIRTAPQPLFGAYWIDNKRARAVIDNPGYTVFRRSLFTVGGSAAVLLLTLLSFYSLFSTILRQKKLAALKDDFIDNVTHELQTPIAALRLTLDSLHGFEVIARKDRFASYLELAATELKRLTEMVDGILLRSTAGDGGEAIPYESVDLMELLRNAADRHRMAAAKPVTFDLPDRERFGVYASPFHLNTILDNLLQNAIRYSAEQGVRIDLRLEPTATGFRLEIADDGWGIAPADRKKVFEKFYRSADTDRNYTVKGLGIGLYHVGQCVAALGGRIRLRENRPRGTVFAIWLPSRPPHSDNAAS